MHIESFAEATNAPPRCPGYVSMYPYGGHGSFRMMRDAGSSRELCSS